jgi:hypothetical protein
MKQIRKGAREKGPVRLTAAKKRAYVKQCGVRCPYCGSEQIEADSYDHESGVISQLVNCLECHFYWYDEYSLTGIIEVAP